MTTSTHTTHARSGRRAGTTTETRKLIENVEWLLASGESGEQTAHRLGYASTASLNRRLRRNGRNNLARRITGSTS